MARWFLFSALIVTCSVSSGCAFTSRLDSMLGQLAVMNRKFDRLDATMSEMNDSLREMDRKMASLERLALRFEEESMETKLKDAALHDGE